ncbi:hypothetical protein TNIN_364521 [Trichonephila inaurata madagascariensis]|uniref:Uncharacterized protein n=1 Tax=Trichonephila inaurata madagascariensis TaxID=2747483 RepID=A0A8X7C1Q4_9ARAC|nr:hypothetical protein TNIN_364521 [Trichonephila inaurata madagascariensis]
MEESEIKDELNKCIMNLDIYSDTELIDFIFFHYRQNTQSYFIASFSADTNFRLLLYAGWIFITVENVHHRLTEFLESQKYAMISYGSKSSVYAFYADNRELVVRDFDILKDVWRLVRYIRKIDIESHNIIFRRSNPRSLANLCLSTIYTYNVRPICPETILQKLGCIDIS